ncbi:hypothetical protein C8J57DRAFT_1712064 [Mycena rebaudengoi]|nr:hypothetical protein C8J57DRAFT_1712064 [Mycena rebaudengoi]
MEVSASKSSLHQAVIVGARDNPPAGTTQKIANEVGHVSAAPLLSEVANNDSTTIESPGSATHSHSLSPGNIGPQPADSAGAPGPEVTMNTPTSAQSQAEITPENFVVNNGARPGTAGSVKSEQGSRHKTPQVDTVPRFDVGKLVSLMEEQVSLLRRIDERQAASDLTQQPMPEVPLTSNSTWGALLRTTVAETIQPKVDRWRSGLDALLVFLGLFSAIVTAFLVESLSGLRPDETARTNELLANLTDIMIALSGVNPVNLNLSTPEQFQPDSTDIRLNSYWSLSLILSLSVAALAVTCRGFLNMVTLSHQAKATDKLIDIKMRWKEADKMLGPVIEMTPQLLVIPVLLFVVGLLDKILSDILQLAVLPTPVVATTSLSFFFIAGVIGFLAYSLFDGSARPHSSPFQSTLAGFISLQIIPMVLPWISWLQARVGGLSALCFPLHTSNSYLSSPESSLSSSRDMAPARNARVVKHYHETVQAINDDDALDKASAALSSVLGPHRHIFQCLVEEEVATLVHLLSLEASIRTNLTAAAAIAGWQTPPYEVADFYINYIPQKLLIALAHAARRSVGGSASLATLSTSTFLAAMVKFVVVSSDPGPEHPSPIRILGSKYTSLEHKSDSKSEVISLMCDVLFNDFVDPLHVNYQHQVTTAAAFFRPATIKTINVVQALCNIRGRHQELVIKILMEAKTGQSVIQDAFKALDLPHVNSVQGLEIVYLITYAGLTRDDSSDHELLRDLCVKCILNIMQDANFSPNPYYAIYGVAKALVKIPFTEEGSTRNARAVLEYTIETKLLTQPRATPRRVMGQNMPMSELAQLLHQMVETDWLHTFNLDAAIHDIRAGRNT